MPTGREARLETGVFVAGAALIEQAGDEKKLLRVTLPLGLRLMPGVQMFIDGEAARNGSYFICYPNGCMADFEVNADFIGRLKSGERLQLRGIDAPGQVASYLLPLGGFAQANEVLRPIRRRSSGSSGSATRRRRARRSSQLRLFRVRRCGSPRRRRPRRAGGGHRDPRRSSPARPRGSRSVVRE